MKKTAKIIICLLSATLLSSPKAYVHADESYVVEGGRETIDFSHDDIEKFDVYTEFDQEPYIKDNAMYFWVLAEQKVIYKKAQFSDIDISVDISTINENGKFDSGIYIQASNVGNDLDHCTAWNVNLEKEAGQLTYKLKLHRFLNNSWVGEKVVRSGLKLPMNKVNLRVVVLEGTLYAFVNHENEPVFSYTIGEGSGYVGFRNFYSPNYFSNLQIIGACNELNKENLKDSLDIAKEIKEIDYTKDSYKSFKESYDFASNVYENGEYQSEIDEAYEALAKALTNLNKTYSYALLKSLVEEIEKANYDETKFTKNSYQALQEVIRRCKELNEGSSEEDISYWYSILLERKNGLIAYL